MSQEIINRVSKSSIVTFNLEELYAPGPRVKIDISQWLHEGFILREKDFRKSLNDIDWSSYKDNYVCLYCSTDAIIPSWAYMLISTYLNPIVKKVIVGTEKDLNQILYTEAISDIDVEAYQNKPLIVKGCSNKPVPETAYLQLIQKLQPVVKSLMFGEACSAVPLFKPKKN
jgi:predicted transcriptional regulator